MKKVLLFIFSTLAISCTDPSGARKTLMDAGYKPIKVGGYGWYQGSKSDYFITKFTAYSPSDSTRVVSGVVCKGLLFKSSTIRLN